MNSENKHLLIGTRYGWGNDTPAFLSTDDRRFHTYVLGKSGSGKSTLLLNLINQEISLGHGVAVIDPHGDLANDVLSSIPRSRTDHVAYLNPADDEFPMAFNPLGARKNPALTASCIVSAFKHIWKDSWGPRLEYILYACVSALLECPNTSFLGIPRMLHDSRYRAWVVRQVRDPMVRSFWVNEFERYDPRFLREAIAPIQNKIGQLVMAPALRNILGQVKSKIDFRFMMDDSRLFIANLSKGLVGEDKCNLLGALLVSQFQIAALSRTDIPLGNRKPFSLFIDEYQNFTSESFAGILAEARKYGLHLTLAHQFLDQVPEMTRASVFGNVANMIVFQIGSIDAERISKEFAETIPPSAFVELNKYEAYVRALQNGDATNPYLLKTLAAKAVNRESINIIRKSRERFTTPRFEVVRKVEAWLAQSSEQPTPRGRRSVREVYWA